MVKTFNSLIDSTLLKTFKELNDASSLAALTFRGSESMKALKELTGASSLAALAFKESESMKAFKELTEASSLAALTFRGSETMKALKELTEASSLAALTFKESETMKTFKELTDSSSLAVLTFKESETMKTFKELTDSIKYSSKAFEQFKPTNLQLDTEFLNSFIELQKSSLVGMNKSDFFDKSVSNKFAHFIDEALNEINIEINKESSENDFNALPERTKKTLIYIYHFYILPLVLTYLFHLYATSNAIEVRKELQTVTTVNEVKKFIKSPSGNFDRTFLIGYRVTTASHLSFRETANLKSNVITFLPIGTLVKVIDKSNRSWLLVEVEIDGNVEQGWVSRRYTASFE